MAEMAGPGPGSSSVVVPLGPGSYDRIVSVESFLKPVLPALGALLAILLTGAGASTAGAGDSLVRASETPDVKELFPEAVEKIRSVRLFSNAIVFEADGSPAKAGAAVGRASQITRWRFVFDNQKTPGKGGKKYPSATMNYEPGSGFAKPVGIGVPFTENVPIPRPPKLSLAAAVRKMRQAGYDQRFARVVLRSPVGPKTIPPQYYFELANEQNVRVSSLTGKVRLVAG